MAQNDDRIHPQVAAGGETVITATWSVKIPMVYNISACLDFVVTTAK